MHHHNQLIATSPVTLSSAPPPFPTAGEDTHDNSVRPSGLSCYSFGTLPLLCVLSPYKIQRSRKDTVFPLKCKEEKRQGVRPGLQQGPPSSPDLDSAD